MRVSALMITVLVCAGCQGDRDLRLSWGGVPASSSRCEARDSDGDCTILVDIRMKSATECEVKVRASQDTVGIKKSEKDKWIYWKIDSAPSGEFVFTKNGIAPKPATITWGDNFKNPKLSDDGRSFRWKNDNKDNQAGREYRYEVRVVNADAVACKQDPIIKNQE